MNILKHVYRFKIKIGKKYLHIIIDLRSNKKQNYIRLI